MLIALFIFKMWNHLIWFENNWDPLQQKVPETLATCYWFGINFSQVILFKYGLLIIIFCKSDTSKCRPTQGTFSCKESELISIWCIDYSRICFEPEMCTCNHLVNDLFHFVGLSHYNICDQMTQNSGALFSRFYFEIVM